VDLSLRILYSSNQVLCFITSMVGKFISCNLQ